MILECCVVLWRLGVERWQLRWHKHMHRHILTHTVSSKPIKSYGTIKDKQLVECECRKNKKGHKRFFSVSLSIVYRCSQAVAAMAVAAMAVAVSVSVAVWKDTLRKRSTVRYIQNIHLTHLQLQLRVAAYTQTQTRANNNAHSRHEIDKTKKEREKKKTKFVFGSDDAAAMSKHMFV